MLTQDTTGIFEVPADKLNHAVAATRRSVNVLCPNRSKTRFRGYRPFCVSLRREVRMRASLGMAKELLFAG